MNSLTIVKQNGGAYIDSREVAEAIGKDHNHLLRDIRGYIKVISKSGASNFGHSDFFIESSYQSTQNKGMTCYLITKMGCEMVANKLTGEKGILFTAAYVTRFNELEKLERREIEAKAATPQLKAFNTAVRNVLAGYSYTRGTESEVMDFLQGAYKPFGIEVYPYGWVGNRPWLTATDIARLIGIYSDTGRLHAHAVSAIIEKLNIAPEHISIVPYGMVGVIVRYDDAVFTEIAKWFLVNGFPHDIPHAGFEYHIHYRRPEPDNRFYLFDDDEEYSYTSDELDAICGKYGDCEDCPGFEFCCLGG